MATAGATSSAPGAKEAKMEKMDLGKVGLWTNQLTALTVTEFRDTVQEIDGL